MVLVSEQSGRALRHKIRHTTMFAPQTTGTQSDLSPGSDHRGHFSFLQYYHQLGYRCYPELLHYMRAMRLDRFFGHPELTANLFIEQSRGYELHHFVLARR